MVRETSGLRNTMTGFGVVRRVFAPALALIALCVLSLQGHAQSSKGTIVRVGIDTSITSATAHHAFESGYFKDEGLEIRFTPNSAGIQSLRQVLAGELDIGSVAPTPIVYAAAGERGLSPNFRIFASILESNRLNNLIILNSEEIADPSLLAGRRLAVTAGTGSEYLWSKMALAFGIAPDSPRIVDMPVPKMAEAARQGMIDAAVAWSPYHLKIAEEAGTRAKVFSGARYHTTGWLAVAQPGYIEKHPDRIAGFLRAMLRAEADLLATPEIVASNHAKNSCLAAEELQERYGDVQFRLSLSESLVVNLSQQFAWARRQGYVTGPMPDFASFLHRDGLDAVRPDAVKLLE